MLTVVNWLLVITGLVTVFVIVLLGCIIYSYKRLTITAKALSVSPYFQITPASVIGSLFSAITRNFVSAAGGIVNGIRLKGKITFLNHSFVPLYIPKIDHAFSIDGKLCLNMVHTPSFWLKPRDSETIPINIVFNRNDVSKVALCGLTHRGIINLEIQSRAAFGHFSYCKITNIAIKVSDYLPKVLKGSKKSPS